MLPPGKFQIYSGGSAVPLFETINVTASGYKVCNLNVRLNIQKDYIGDLKIVLTSPQGTSVNLLDRPGCPNNLTPGAICGGSEGCEAGFSHVAGTNPALPVDIADTSCSDTVFQDTTTGGASCDTGPLPPTPVPVPTPIYCPNEPLSTFDGQDPEGIWTLAIFDFYNGGESTGELDCFAIFGDPPP